MIMLRDFIDDANDVITLENSMALATYLEIDENMVLESFKDFAASAKERIMKFVEKVAKFVRGAKEKVKQRLMVIMKMEIGHIDRGVYKYLWDVNSKIKKVSSTANIDKITSKIQLRMKEKRVERSVNKGIKKGSFKKDPELDAITTMVQRMKHQLSTISTKLPDNAKTGVKMTYKYSSMTALSTELNNTLTQLNKDIDSLKSAASKLDSNTSIDNRAISSAISIIDVNVMKAQKQIAVINAIIANTSVQGNVVK